MNDQIVNIIPKIKFYGKPLSEKEYLYKTWSLITNNDEIIKFTFKKNNGLIISTNGNIEKGKWQILNPEILIIESNRFNLQFVKLFFNSNILILKKPNKSEDLFILIYEYIITNSDPVKYLKSILEKGPNDDGNAWEKHAVPIIFVLVVVYIIFVNLFSH